MKLLRISMLCVFISALFVLHSSAVRSVQHTDAIQKQSAAPAAPEDSAYAADHKTLFPTLDPQQITSLHIRTEESSFEFLHETLSSVSVNGNRADTEIYHTLVSQIRQLPVSTHKAFVPDSTPVLTLVVSTEGGAKHTARFYCSGSAQQVRIACGSAESPSYYQTDAWRIGTLMMTCEGTRIQDALGNETPAVRL